MDAMTTRARIFCNNCRHNTIHDLVYSYEPENVDALVGDPQEVFDKSIVQLWACRGCEHVTMQELALDEGGEEIGSEFYPSREKHHHIRKSFLQLNRKLSQIYEEIIIAYNSGSTILCAAGLRSLLEGVCADRGIEGRNLYEKIRNMSSILPGNIVTNLQHFRFMGNEAVHQLNAPSLEDIHSAIEIMEDLLNYLYDLDYKAANLSRLAGSESSGQKQVTPKIEVIKRILERTPPLAPRPIALCKALYTAGQKGLKYEDIAAQMENTTLEQLAGVLGAMGRRVNNTDGVEGKPGITYLFEIVREIDGDPGSWGWRMRYELVQTIKNGSYSWASDWE